jgi:crotonobetainyl-CoA:carnitine CoA-transferase CaiB-like acyl-CoA transferase
VDVTTVLMGTYDAQILCDMGADVINVEPPQGNGSLDLDLMPNPGMGTIFMHANRIKRSIMFGGKKSAVHAAFLRFEQSANVLIISRPCCVSTSCNSDSD